MAKSHVIEVECKCGNPLARYYKDVPGILLKLYLDEIRIDRAKIFEGKHDKGYEFKCPKCERLIGIADLVKGRPAVKVEQKNLKRIKF